MPHQFELPEEGLRPDSVVARWMGKHPRTLYRWDLDPEVDFPKPIVIRKRKHRDCAAIRAWMKEKQET